MSLNTFGRLFRVTTWGESHGPALGATVDGCPPGIPVDEAFLQQWLDRRRPGQSKHTTQRKEADAVRILSGVFEGQTTGTPVQLMIENTDQRSRDYGDISPEIRRSRLSRRGAQLGPGNGRTGGGGRPGPRRAENPGSRA